MACLAAPSPLTPDLPRFPEPAPRPVPRSRSSGRLARLPPHTVEYVYRGFRFARFAAAGARANDRMAHEADRRASAGRRAIPGEKP